MCHGPQRQLPRGSYDDGLFASPAPASALLFAILRFIGNILVSPKAAKGHTGQQSIEPER
jgi:hypothetical protein